VNTNVSVEEQHVGFSASEQNITPVWLRIPGAVRVSGLGRSRLYELIRDQKIRSKVLKKRRDSQRGIRLISYDSLLEFINGDGQ
jgi:hypothetical protein